MIITAEETSAIVGFPHYSVTNLGRVFDCRTGRAEELKGSLNQKGYRQVSLKVKGKHHVTKLVHRLVAEAFIPNPDKLKHIHHLDEDKTNNDVSNLVWISPKAHDKLHRNTEARHPQIVSDYMSGMSTKEVAKRNNVSNNVVARVIKDYGVKSR